MKTDNSPFIHGSLEVVNGKVEGTIYTDTFEHEEKTLQVAASVTSYDYEQSGETKTNHVPHVVVTDNRGHILREPEVRDTHNAKKSITLAKGYAEDIYKNDDRYHF